MVTYYYYGHCRPRSANVQRTADHGMLSPHLAHFRVIPPLSHASQRHTRRVCGENVPVTAVQPIIILILRRGHYRIRGSVRNIWLGGGGGDWQSLHVDQSRHSRAEATTSTGTSQHGGKLRFLGFLPCPVLLFHLPNIDGELINLFCSYFFLFLLSSLFSLLSSPSSSSPSLLP